MGCGGIPHTLKIVFIIRAFFNSVKPLNLEEEKGCVLGSEPVAEFLPSARFKSGINLVHDTVYLQG